MTTAVAAPASVVAANEALSGRDRVVVGMDDDPVSLAALRLAATQAAYRGCDVLAIHVWHYPALWGYPVMPEFNDLGPHIMQTLEASVRGILAERVAAGEPTVTIAVEVVQGVTASVLRDAAHGAELLVLGARHHNRLVGSVSRACSSSPPCPVVIVPAPRDS